MCGIVQAYGRLYIDCQGCGKNVDIFDFGGKPAAVCLDCKVFWDGKEWRKLHNVEEAKWKGNAPATEDMSG